MGFRRHRTREWAAIFPMCAQQLCFACLPAGPTRITHYCYYYVAATVCVRTVRIRSLSLSLSVYVCVCDPYSSPLRPCSVVAR